MTSAILIEICVRLALATYTGIDKLLAMPVSMLRTIIDTVTQTKGG